MPKITDGLYSHQCNVEILKQKKKIRKKYGNKKVYMCVTDKVTQETVFGVVMRSICLCVCHIRDPIVESLD